MNLSAKCDYACRAMLELASLHDTGKPLSTQAIAESRGIPEKYLTHIMLQLKRAKLVRSIRGAQGGYFLCEPPARISLLQIVEAIDGPVMNPGQAGDTGNAELSPLWLHLRKGLRVFMEDLSLVKMLDMTTRTNMFHI